MDTNNLSGISDATTDTPREANPEVIEARATPVETETVIETPTETEATTIEDALPPRYTADTVYTMDRLCRYNNFTALSKKWIWIILGVCTGFVLLTLILDIALFGIKSELWLHTGLILAIDAIYIIFTFLVPRIAYKKSPSLNAVVRQEFYSDILVTIAKTDKINERTELSYSVITKVRESREDIYLYISANQAHIIAKDAISPADLDGFLAHIRARANAKAFKQ